MRVSADEMRELTRGSKLEAEFARQILARGYPIPEREYRFARSLKSPTGRPRQWRLDFAWIEDKVGVEVDGGTWAGGRHTRGAGFRGDCQKLNAAVQLGWFVLRGDTTMVKSGELADALGETLNARTA